jgi:hypothetical protein
LPNDFPITKHHNATERSIAVIFNIILLILLIVIVIFILVIHLRAAFNCLSLGRCFAPLATLRSGLDLLLGLLVLNECAKNTDLVVLVGLEIEAKLLTETQLEQVVVKGIFGYSDFQGGIL